MTWPKWRKARAKRWVAAVRWNGQECCRSNAAFFEEAGGDGFMLSPIYAPGPSKVVDQVVPELQSGAFIVRRIKVDAAGSACAEHAAMNELIQKSATECAALLNAGDVSSAG